MGYIEPTDFTRAVEAEELRRLKEKGSTKPADEKPKPKHPLVGQMMLMNGVPVGVITDVEMDDRNDEMTVSFELSPGTYFPPHVFVPGKPCVYCTNVEGKPMDNSCTCACHSGAIACRPS